MNIGNITSSAVSKLGAVNKQASKTPIKPQASECFRGSEAYNVAKEFKKNAINIFSDWKSGFPKDGESGCKVLEKTLAPYTEQIKSLKQPEAQYFTKLCFGKETLQALEDGSLINSALKNFKVTLEEGMGTTVKELIKAYK